MTTGEDSEFPNKSSHFENSPGPLGFPLADLCKKPIDFLQKADIPVVIDWTALYCGSRECYIAGFSVNFS